MELELLNYGGQTNDSFKRIVEVINSNFSILKPGGIGLEIINYGTQVNDSFKKIIEKINNNFSIINTGGIKIELINYGGQNNDSFKRIIEKISTNFSLLNDIDTTVDGKQVFMIIGDSNAAGNAPSTPTATYGSNLVYEWNGSALIEMTQAYLNSQGIGTVGRSSWVEYANNYIPDNPSKKVVIVNNGLSGSCFNIATVGLSWDTNGSLLTNAFTKTDSCLSSLGLTRPKYVLINLGVNDAFNATLTVAHVQSLLNRILAKYPKTQICMAQFASDGPSADYVIYRNIMKNAMRDYSNVWLGPNGGALQGAGMQSGTGAHYTLAGYNYVGAAFARWSRNTNYSKWARAIISSQFDELSIIRKTKIETFINAIGVSSYLDLDLLSPYKAVTDANNVFLDWCFQSQPQNPGAAVLTLNDNLATNGSTTYFTTGCRPAQSIKNGSSSNQFQMIKFKANNTAGGTLAYAFGGLFGGSLTGIKQQVANNIKYSNGDADGGITNATHTAFNNDTAYTCARNPVGEEIAYINGVEIARQTISIFAPPCPVALGGLNTANTYPTHTMSNLINATFEYYVVGKFTTVDQLILYNAMEALVDGW